MIQLAITDMYKNTPKKRQDSGFTIVELIVVIIVIGVLAGIGAYSFSSANKHQRDADRGVHIALLKDALEKYYSKNGQYPLACPSNNAACPIGNLTSYLVPNFIKEIPHDPRFYDSPNGSYTDYQYIQSGGFSSYGIHMSYELKTPNLCKAGKNMTSSWWGVGTPACDVDSNIL